MLNLLGELTTEQLNPRTAHIDGLETEQIIRLIHEEDRQIADSIRAAIPQIAAGADMIVHSLQNGGRLFYVGAGTSGRLGILDASECPPTYGIDPSQVQGIIAGGMRAVTESVESAEDDEQLGIRDIEERDVCAQDCVIGIAASGRTPYVLAAMKRSAELGASVIGLCNNRNTPMKQFARLVIEAVTGPEVILGSTRMKAGTSQKQILNMLTTTAMIRLGKVFGNLMVDLQPSNEKLLHRAKRIVQIATSGTDAEVNEAFAASGGNVKLAIVMMLAGLDRGAAEQLLAQSNGFVREALRRGGSDADSLQAGDSEAAAADGPA